MLPFKDGLSLLIRKLSRRRRSCSKEQKESIFKVIKRNLVACVIMARKDAVERIGSSLLTLQMEISLLLLFNEYLLLLIFWAPGNFRIPGAHWLIRSCVWRLFLCIKIMGNMKLYLHC